MLHRLSLRHVSKLLRNFHATRYENALCRRGWYDPNARSEAPVIFIGGCSRSGTTLLREVLDRHSNLACGVETALFVPPFETKRIAERSEINRKILDEMVASSRNILEFSELFFERFVRYGSATRWVDKSPHNARVVGRLLNWFPRAVFLHIIRDGRDVVCSLRHHPRERLVNGEVRMANVSRTITACAQTWVAETKIALEYRGHPRYREVRYEDLVENTEATVRDICSFVGEAFEPTMIEPGPVSGPPARLLNNDNATGPINSGRVDRWVKDLKIGERSAFTGIAGDLLCELGYVTDHHWIHRRMPGGAAQDIDKTAFELLRTSLTKDRRTASLSVCGDCMAPLIRDGDVVRLLPFEGSPKIGSVVVAETENEGIVCHRVLEQISSDRIAMSGDRSSRSHEAELSDIIGIVSTVRRGAREIELAGLFYTTLTFLRLAQVRATQHRTCLSRIRAAILRRFSTTLSRLFLGIAWR